MRTIGAYEAKTHLPRLLDEVAAGATIVITKHGVPVAQLVPPPTGRRVDAKAAIKDWRTFRRQERITLDGLSLREMIEEGPMWRPSILMSPSRLLGTVPATRPSAPPTPSIASVTTALWCPSFGRWRSPPGCRSASAGRA